MSRNNDNHLLIKNNDNSLIIENQEKINNTQSRNLSTSNELNNKKSHKK